MTVKELYDHLESIIKPLEIEGIDSDGIHTMPNQQTEVKKVLIALDPYDKAVNEAIAGEYDVLLTHHPLFWGEPLPNTPPEYWYNKLMRAGISSYSFHIRLDRAEGGVNDILAQRLGLIDTVPFDEPEIPGLGRVGYLPDPMSEAELAEHVKIVLNAQMVRYTLLPDGRKIKKVAVLGGAASDAVSAAAAAGADAIIGGEFKHHAYGYAMAEAKGIAIIEAGHYHTEVPVCERLRDLVVSADPIIQVDILSCNNTVII